MSEKCLPKKYWHQGAIDEQTSFDHEECGDTRGRLFVKRVDGGYVHHCHNCAPRMSGFTASDVRRTPMEIKAALEQKERQVRPTERLVLPRTFTKELSQKHRLWLNRWITDEEIERYGIGEGFEGNRIVFPIYDGEGEPFYYQARALEGKPKWLNPRLNGKTVFFAAGECDGASVVIVEAILSAIVVGRQAYSVALLGSYVPNEIVHIVRPFDTIYVWLDPDKYAESIKAARRLKQLTGKTVYPIRSERKPRDYSDEQIRTFIDQV